jgi:hypothetical protein
VNAGVEPQRFEIDGKIMEGEPLHGAVAVSADAFEAIRHQAADDHSRMMPANVTLVGDQLPEPGEFETTSRYTEPNGDQRLLIKQLKLELPPQPRPRITAAGQIVQTPEPAL